MRSIFLSGILLVGSLVLAACGGGAPPAPTLPAASAPAQAAAQEPIEVQVTLTEFKIESALTNFQANTPYRFVVKNAGTVNHDFAIAPPMMHHGGMSMSSDDAHKDALLVIEANELPPGATKTAEVTFAKPTAQAPLEFACHTPGHYEAGMLLPITVN